MADRGTPQPPKTSEITFREGFIIVAALLGVMVVVAALRYAFIGCIDVCILGNRPWPFSRRRRQTQAEEMGDQDQQVVDDSQDINNVLSGISPEEREVVIDSLLSYKTISSEDLVIWRGSQSGASEQVNHSNDENPKTEQTDNSTCSLGNTGDVVCSICLHDIEIGAVAVTPRSCNHLFHRKCILEWLNRNAVCPYCRTNIITEDAVKDALESQP